MSLFTTYEAVHARFVAAHCPPVVLFFNSLCGSKVQFTATGSYVPYINIIVVIFI